MPTDHAHAAFVGAGPGRPDLLTLRGRDLIAKADLLLVDDLVHSECYLRWMRSDARVIRCGKRAHRFCTPQPRIHAWMLQALAAGQRVVRLKGGDPMLFARLREELDAVRCSGAPYEIVPGITAASGAAAYAEWFLTERGAARSVTLLTGTVAGNDLDWQAAVRLGRLVLYMGILHLHDNVAHLLDAGLAPDTPVQVVRWGSRGWQRRVTGSLASLADKVAAAGLRPPALLLVGDGGVEDSSWFESAPLFGTTVLTFRPDERGWSLADRLRDLGAEAMNYPLRRVEEIPQARGGQRAAHDGYHLFTSAIAARLAPAVSPALAVGRRTAERLTQRGLPPVRTGRAGVAELFAGFDRETDTVARVVTHWCGLPRRAEAAPAVADAGMAYQPVVLYRTRPWLPAIAAMRSRLWRLPPGTIFFFTSPELFRLAAPFLKESSSPPRIWVIGATTARAVEASGWQVEHCLSQPDDRTLVADLLTRREAS